jgi:hypothetical protein
MQSSYNGTFESGGRLAKGKYRNIIEISTNHSTRNLRTCEQVWAIKIELNRAQWGIVGTNLVIGSNHLALGIVLT